MFNFVISISNNLLQLLFVEFWGEKLHPCGFLVSWRFNFSQVLWYFQAIGTRFIILKLSSLPNVDARIAVLIRRVLSKVFLWRLCTLNLRRIANIVSELLAWDSLNADLRMGEAARIVEETAFVVEKVALVVEVFAWKLTLVRPLCDITHVLLLVLKVCMTLPVHDTEY